MLQSSFLVVSTKNTKLHHQSPQRCLQTKSFVSNQGVCDQSRTGTTIGERSTKDGLGVIAISYRGSQVVGKGKTTPICLPLFFLPKFGSSHKLVAY